MTIILSKFSMSNKPNQGSIPLIDRLGHPFVFDLCRDTSHHHHHTQAIKKLKNLFGENVRRCALQRETHSLASIVSFRRVS